MALLPVFALLYQACRRAISSSPKSAVFCCILMCAPSLSYVLVVLLCFMIWTFWLTSIFFFFSLNSWFSVMGPWVGGGCGE